MTTADAIGKLTEAVRVLVERLGDVNDRLDALTETLTEASGLIEDLPSE